MRKLIAVLLTICLVFPLLLASLTAFSTISWALDRTFYTDALDQDQVYQALLSDQTLDDILRSQIALPADADTQALNEVLRSVITQDYLKNQMGTFVNGFFDNMQGITLEFTPSIDLQPIKNALSGDKQDEFLSALVTALPTCAAGQTPGFGDGQTPCKPQGISDEQLIENYLKPALPQFLAQVPDEIQMGGAWQQWQTQNEWHRYLPGMAGPAGVMLSVLFLAFIALCFWYITALIADSSWRVRLQWLGWTLMISALPVFIIGLVLHSSTALYWAQYGLQHAQFGNAAAFLNSPVVLQAITTSILPRIAGAFLAVGGVAGSLALGLIVWGLATSREKQVA
jgi:hypothetical protein